MQNNLLFSIVMQFFCFLPQSEYEQYREDVGGEGGGDWGNQGGKHGYGEYYDDYDDDNASMVSLPAELPPPPDGGWGWVIVIVSFLCNMVVDGIAYSFSPFLDVLVVSLNSTQGKVSWVSSLLAGVYLSAGM